MKRNIYLILLLTFISIIFLSLSIGPFKISIIQIIEIILEKTSLLSDNYQVSFEPLHQSVLWDIRLPRILLGIIAGFALGSSGAILQGLFRNPLVDPGFIGVSSGAAVGAMIAIMFSSFFMFYFPKWIAVFILPLMAGLGAFFSTMSVYKMSKISNKTNIMAMLLSGIAVNAFAGSIIGLFISLSSDAELRSFTFWTLGGLDNANWKVVTLSSVVIFFLFIPMHSIRYQLDIFMLGDGEAYNLGLNVESLKKQVVLIASMMVGLSVAFCGMIGFVGLVTPHLVRFILGPKHKHLIPGSAILGAILLVSSDLISKIIIAPAQLPIGVVTSAIGAPFFIWLIFNYKTRIGYSEQ